MNPECRYCGRTFRYCTCHSGYVPASAPSGRSDRWRRDRHDRKAWHPARDALRTMRRVVRPHLHPEDRADAVRFPVAAGKYTAALVNGPHFHALNIAADTLEGVLDELRAGFGVLQQCSGNEWELAERYGWYVIVYAPQAQAVAA